MPHLTLTGKI